MIGALVRELAALAAVFSFVAAVGAGVVTLHDERSAPNPSVLAEVRR
ncbi:hypothetical protein [Aureimonas ureilytica]|nr:hypothetical protein [Aureimonas ureilytica]